MFLLTYQSRNVIHDHMSIYYYIFSAKDERKILNGPVLSLTTTPEIGIISPKLQIVFEHSLVS